MQYKFFKFNFAFDLYLENAKRYKIRNKKLAKIVQGGGAKTAQGGGDEFLYLNLELLFLNFVKSFVPKNLAPSWPKSSVRA